MDDQLFSLKTDFYITLATKTNNAIFLGDAHKDIEYLLGKYGFKNFYCLEHREFASGRKNRGLAITVIHPHIGDENTDDKLKRISDLCDNVAKDFRNNFRLSHVLIVHYEVAGRLVTEEELPDA